MKKIVIALSICCVILSGITYRTSLQNDALRTIVRLGDDEIRILTYELKEEKSKPTFDDGYKTALIKSGGPNQGGQYQEGWDDAQKIFLNEGYQTGYHNCLTQFGYQRPDTSRYLAPEPKSTPIPAKPKDLTELSQTEILP